jgi:hypothetical protein
MTTAGPTMTRHEREEAVLRCLAMFGDHKPEFKDEVLPEFVQDGYRYRVRRIYLRGDAPLSERDVEYRVEASNLEFIKRKSEHRKWACWLYMNLPGYLCSGKYPALRDTNYGVQWSRY